MKISIFDLHQLKTYKNVVILVKYNDRWLFLQKKESSEWEIPFGEIEQHEKPIDAAKRHLREKTGALNFSIKPVFDFWTADDSSQNNGMAFYAEIIELGKLSDEYQTEKTGQFKNLPACLKYPEITALLFDELIKYNSKEKLKKQYAEEK